MVVHPLEKQVLHQQHRHRPSEPPAQSIQAKKAGHAELALAEGHCEKNSTMNSSRAQAARRRLRLRPKRQKQRRPAKRGLCMRSDSDHSNDSDEVTESIASEERRDARARQSSAEADGPHAATLNTAHFLSMSLQQQQQVLLQNERMLFQLQQHIQQQQYELTLQRQQLLLQKQASPRLPGISSPRVETNGGEEEDHMHHAQRSSGNQNRANSENDDDDGDDGDANRRGRKGDDVDAVLDDYSSSSSGGEGDRTTTGLGPNTDTTSLLAHGTGTLKEQQLQADGRRSTSDERRLAPEVGRRHASVTLITHTVTAEARKGASMSAPSEVTPSPPTLALLDGMAPTTLPSPAAYEAKKNSNSDTDTDTNIGRGLRETARGGWGKDEQHGFDGGCRERRRRKRRKKAVRFAGLSRRQSTDLPATEGTPGSPCPASNEQSTESEQEEAVDVFEQVSASTSHAQKRQCGSVGRNHDFATMDGGPWIDPRSGSVLAKRAKLAARQAPFSAPPRHQDALNLHTFQQLLSQPIQQEYQRLARASMSSPNSSSTPSPTLTTFPSLRGMPNASVDACGGEENAVVATSSIDRDQAYVTKSGRDPWSVNSATVRLLIEEHQQQQVQHHQQAQQVQQVQTSNLVGGDSTEAMSVLEASRCKGSSAEVASEHHASEQQPRGLLFFFDDSREAKTWDEAMREREQARRNYLKVQRGRRASRNKGHLAHQHHQHQHQHRPCSSLDKGEGVDSFIRPDDEVLNEHDEPACSFRDENPEMPEDASLLCGHAKVAPHVMSSLDLLKGSGSAKHGLLLHKRGPQGTDEGDDEDGSEGESGAIDTMCPMCGKTYRQNNSFYKHLYEHHPHWSYVVDNFKLTKHQQVMMMQTAELLLSLRFPTTHGLQPLVRFDG